MIHNNICQKFTYLSSSQSQGGLLTCIQPPVQKSDRLHPPLPPLPRPTPYFGDPSDSIEFRRPHVEIRRSCRNVSSAVRSHCNQHGE